LGAVLEQISGLSYEQLLQDRIFRPLGMKDFGYTHSEAVIEHRAAGYLWDQAPYREQLLPARLRDLLFKPNLENYGYGWVMLVAAPDSP
jgi:CubicO group peptidase (beta-lactamase class C family)